MNSEVEKVCRTCNAWIEKYQECDNEDAPRRFAGGYSAMPDDTCECWHNDDPYSKPITSE